jgi:N-methylhydantoinase B
MVNAAEVTELPQSAAVETRDGDEIVVVRTPGRDDTTILAEVDPVTTEVIRNALNSAAEQMKRGLIRTAFSLLMYEVLDFACAIYDRKMRLLAQAPTFPIFMGTLSFCVEAGVAAVGGDDALEPGDIILYNIPYGTGSHMQDAALIMPIFFEGEVIAYAAIKAHWLDIGGKDPYSTDTVDVHQEGTIYPGVKLYQRGEVVGDVYRIILANSRIPKMIAGDINAQVVGLRAGSASVVRLVKQYGLDVFRSAAERMFDHGERVIREYFDKIPDGVYVESGEIDSNGISDERIPFSVRVEVDGSNVRVDYSAAPPAQAGPMNCPLPSTVSATRVAISMLAGTGESPNEGCFRPLEVVVRPGSMFHPLPPSPCFLFAWPAFQAIEVIYKAIARAMPTAVPASSGGDIVGVVWWGIRRSTGEPWAEGGPNPIGHGAWAGGDGASSLIHIGQACSRISPVEVLENRYPWLLRQAELAPDSCGAGKYRGGLGLNMDFEMLDDSWLTSVVERTKNQPWGLEGGTEARANSVAAVMSDGTRKEFGKITRFLLPRGAVLELRTAGGGGYGPPHEREKEAIEQDLRGGYITSEFARRHYNIPEVQSERSGDEV